MVSGAKNIPQTLLMHHNFPKGGATDLISDRKGSWGGMCVCSISRIQMPVSSFGGKSV